MNTNGIQTLLISYLKKRYYDTDQTIRFFLDELESTNNSDEVAKKELIEPKKQDKLEKILKKSKEILDRSMAKYPIGYCNPHDVFYNSSYMKLKNDLLKSRDRYLAELYSRKEDSELSTMEDSEKIQESNDQFKPQVEQPISVENPNVLTHEPQKINLVASEENAKFLELTTNKCINDFADSVTIIENKQTE